MFPRSRSHNPHGKASGVPDGCPGTGSRVLAHHGRGRSWFRPLGLLLLLAVFTGLPGLFAANAQPFQFILRNGDRLTGTVVAEDKNSIIITNDLIGRILIPASQLDRREAVVAAVLTPARPPAPTNAAPALTPDQRKRLDDLAHVYMAGDISATEFQSRRTNLWWPRPAAPKQWSGEILAGMDLGWGEKNRQNFSGRVKINFQEKRFRNAFDYLFSYGHTEGELSAHRMDTTDKIDFDLNPRYYLYALGGAGYDAVRKIDYYLQGGPGMGEHLIKRTNLVLNAEAGVSYQLQNFEGGTDTHVFYYRVAQDLKWAITPKLTFDEKLEYLPQWDNFNQFKARAEANLRFWLMENLSLNLTVIDFYDTRVAPGVGRNDLQLRSSIGVKF